MFLQNVLKLATDAFGTPFTEETPCTEGANVLKKETTVEFSTDEFIFVNNPSPYQLGKISDLQTRVQAASTYLHESDPTKKEPAKNAFLVHTGYENPDVIPNDEARTIAEACLQELSCQSIKRRSDLKSDTTNGLTKVSFIDHDPLAGLFIDEDYFKLV